jgi:hypothetical protein
MEGEKDIINKNQILRPTATSEFEEGDKKTILGWLQELYLYTEDDKGYVDPKPTRLTYNKAITLLRKHAKLGKDSDLLSFEEKTTETKAATLLNQVIKEMG